MNLQTFLSEHHARFQTLEHPKTFSAQHMAHALHVPGDNIAKTVVLKVDGRYVLAVLQATHNVDLPLAREALQAESVKLALEGELAQFFTDCELGAVPPFGSHYGVDTLVDESLTHDNLIVFEGGSHREAICMSYRDFEEIERPQVAVFSRPI
jgi:Ala-tRNA(Pro) deacylase